MALDDERVANDAAHGGKKDAAPLTTGSNSPP